MNSFPTVAVRVLRFLDRISRFTPILRRPCNRIAAAILERVLAKARRQGEAK